MTVTVHSGVVSVQEDEVHQLQTSRYQLISSKIIAVIIIIRITPMYFIIKVYK